MAALQAEYRWNFRPRLGLVGFVGLATVFGAINEDDSGKLLPGCAARLIYPGRRSPSLLALSRTRDFSSAARGFRETRKGERHYGAT